MIKKLISYKRTLKIAFWLWLIFIFVVSSLPNIPTQEINIWDEPFRLDYFEHFGVFAILLGLFVLWKSDLKGVFVLKKQWLYILLLIVFAILDELHQLIIPGRSYNILDLTYNLAGLIAGLYCTKFCLFKIINRQKPNHD
jgi:VanZ family protein